MSEEIKDIIPEEEETDYITLEFDDGESIECEVLTIFEYNGKEYIALLPEDEEEEDIFIYGYKESGEEDFELIDIEDDEEFEAVSAELDRIMDEAAGSCGCEDGCECEDCKEEE